MYLLLHYSCSNWVSASSFGCRHCFYRSSHFSGSVWTRAEGSIRGHDPGRNYCGVCGSGCSSTCWTPCEFPHVCWVTAAAAGSRLYDNRALFGNPLFTVVTSSEVVLVLKVPRFQDLMLINELKTNFKKPNQTPFKNLTISKIFTFCLNYRGKKWTKVSLSVK